MVALPACLNCTFYSIHASIKLYVSFASSLLQLCSSPARLMAQKNKCFFSSPSLGKCEDVFYLNTYFDHVRAKMPLCFVLALHYAHTISSLVTCSFRIRLLKNVNGLDKSRANGASGEYEMCTPEKRKEVFCSCAVCGKAVVVVTSSSETRK